MWFKQQKSVKSNAATNSQALLSSILSNGVDIAMPELIQYQSKTALIDLTARKNIQGQQSGHYLSRHKGRGMEFDEVRHYQTGDDIRAIDWRVTARTGKTHTKLFREEVERPVLVATDLSTNMHFGSQLLFKSVQAAHLASLVAWHAKSRGDRIGGIVFNNNEHLELKPRSRKEGVLHYLHALTSIHNNTNNILQQTRGYTPSETRESPATNFQQNCARLRQLAKPGALVYFITDARQLCLPTQNRNSILRHLSQIAQHCELVICLIDDPLELTLPQSAVMQSVNLTDGINKQQLTLGCQETSLAYSKQAQQMIEKRKELLSQTGARVVNLSSGKTLEQQLKQGSL